MSELLWLVAVLCVVVGLIGVVLPALPGTLRIFAGLVIGAWADGFTRVGWWTLAGIGLVGVLSYAVEFLAAAFGAQKLGTSPRAMVGAGLGTLLGLFFGLPGLVLGPFVGAVLGELSTHRDLKRAGRAGVAAWIGFVIGAIVKVGLACLMVAIFLAALFVF